ncbi:MAG: response regulator [Silicimonas sp.]|nr:response regulator [Silicimonas sp.]
MLISVPVPRLLFCLVLPFAFGPTLLQAQAVDSIGSGSLGVVSLGGVLLALGLSLALLRIRSMSRDRSVAGVAGDMGTLRSSRAAEADLSMKQGVARTSGACLNSARSTLEHLQTIAGKPLPGRPARRAMSRARMGSGPQDRPPGRGETVFVVEDDAAGLLDLQLALEALGYRVISATSGMAALRLIDQGVAFDLMIADLTWPGGGSGFDLAARLRRRGHGARVLYRVAGDGARPGQGAPMPILSKSASSETLARAVRAALSRRLH